MCRYGKCSFVQRQCVDVGATKGPLLFARPGEQHRSRCLRQRRRRRRRRRCGLISCDNDSNTDHHRQAHAPKTDTAVASFAVVAAFACPACVHKPSHGAFPNHHCYYDYLPTATIGREGSPWKREPEPAQRSTRVPTRCAGRVRMRRIRLVNGGARNEPLRQASSTRGTPSVRQAVRPSVKGP